MPGEFIDVRVDPDIAQDREIAKKLEEICPVSIFEAGADGVRIDEAGDTARRTALLHPGRDQIRRRRQAVVGDGRIEGGSVDAVFDA